MCQVALVDDGSDRFPIEAKTVITDAGIVGWLVDGGCFVDHDGVRLEAQESMSNALGNVKDVAVGGTKFHGGGLPVSGGVPAEIQENIPDAAADAIDQLRVIVRGQLEMHASDDALAGGGEKLFGRLKIDTEAAIESFVHRFDEVAPVIQEDAWCKQESTRQWFTLNSKHR